MVKEIRIYVEGGGNYSLGQSQLRRGFKAFLIVIVENARSKNIKWEIIPCGGGRSTYQKFRNAITDHPEAFNILLVDAEDSVNQTPWEHLRTREENKLEKPKGVDDENCHLMVQVMESWFLADKEALKKFYGKGFKVNSLPKNPEIEQISKSDVKKGLKSATAKTQKRKYHKINHGPKILEKLDVSKVRGAAPHCNRLFKTLENKIGSN